MSHLSLTGAGAPAASVVAPFDLLPVADSVEGGWAAAPLWSKVDDASDADFIRASSLGSGDPCVLDFAAWTNPGSISAGTAIVISAREAGGDGAITIRLLDSGVEVAAFAMQTVTTTFAQYTFTLDAAQRTALLGVATGHTLQWEASPDFGGGAAAVDVGQVKLAVVP